MAKVIILEGVDCSGKTTLAEQLTRPGSLDRCRSCYQHHGLYPDDTPAQLLRRYAQSILLADRRASRGWFTQIIDRCFLSEQVYGTIVRQEDRLGELGVKLLTRLTRALGVCEVFCTPPWKTVEAGWTEKKKDTWDPVKGKGDYLQKLEVVRQVWRRYDDYVRPWSFKYDYTSFSSARHRGLILTTELPKLPATMLGSPEAEVVFVGDQVNVKKTSVDLPFFELGGSSGYLLRAIVAAGIPESKIAFVNAHGVDGRPKDLEKMLLQLPNFKRTVALGNKAWKRVRNNWIVPHPSYWKRFQNGKLENYAQLIKEASGL